MPAAARATTTAHADLHWTNLTEPNLCILDQESWRRAPAGYVAATLCCTRPPRTGIPDPFPTLFDTPSGRISVRSALCRYLWLVDEGGEYQNLNEPLRALGTTLIRTL